MPNVIVCYKWVLDEQDIKIMPQSLALDTSRAKGKISDYDRNALEEGAKIAAEKGFEVNGLTFGAADAKQSLKDCLARGADQVYWVNDDIAKDADSNMTAKVLAAAIKKIGNFDIILCGEGASNTYAHQVGPRIASLLGIPVITYVNKIEVEEEGVKANRKLGDTIEVVKASFPVLITVLPEINTPRICSMKEIMRAAKKPVTELNIGDLGLDKNILQRKTAIEGIRGYKMVRKNIIYKEGDLKDITKKLTEELLKSGVL